MRSFVKLFACTCVRVSVIVCCIVLFSANAYAQCDCPPVSTCATCVGGLTSLTLRYKNPVLPTPTVITVMEGGGAIIHTGLVASNGTFTITPSVAGEQFVGGQITISATPITTTLIATTCASSISVGDIFGNFTVEAAQSMSGKPLCCAAEDQETIPPTILSCPSDVTISLPSNTCETAVSWTAPTVSDNCAVASFVPSHAPGSTFAIGTTTVQYTATDNYGNVSTCSFNVIVKDVTAPVISGCPNSPITVKSTTQCGAVATWATPTVTDNCTGYTLSSNFNSGALFPVGTTTVTYTAKDGSGNTSTCSFDVVVTDNSTPSVSNCPSNISVALGPSGCTTAVTWTPPTFSDNCTLAVTSTHSPGDYFDEGVTTVTYTAEDPAGNKKSCSFKVTVKDNTDPVITGCPANITVDAGNLCFATVSWTPPSFSDNCAATMTSSHVPGTQFPVGTTEVKYTATDESNNKARCTFTVTVVEYIKPVFTSCPANIVLNADPNSCSAVATWNAPIAVDNCAITYESNFTSGASFAVGTTAVIYTATDLSGNSATCTFNVTVKDVTAPVATTCPANITVSAASNACSQVVTWLAPVFSSSCGGATISTTHSPGATFAIGITTVTYSAVDESGNKGTCSFDVTVIDDIAPVFKNCPNEIVIDANEACSAVGTWTAPEVSDNCSATVTSSHIPGETFPIGATLVTYSAKDQAGNVSQCSFKVIVRDNSAPVFLTKVEDITVNVNATDCNAKASWSEPQVSDCSALVVTSSHHSGDHFPVGTTVVEYVAEDADGNKSTLTFSVTVGDKTAPEISNAPKSIVKEIVEGCDAVVSWEQPTVNNDCGELVLKWSHQSGDRFPLGVTRVRFTATDQVGNVAAIEFDVIIKAATTPMFTSCPSDILIKTTKPGKSEVNWEIPSFSSQCALKSLTSNYSPGDEFEVGETMVEYVATDISGAVVTCSFKVIVQLEKLEVTPAKVISPDGDGVNDNWQVQNIEKFHDNKIVIVDRWGGVVFSAEGYNNESVLWRGQNSRGSTVPTGTYFYTITVRSFGAMLEKKGFIEVIN